MVAMLYGGNMNSENVILNNLKKAKSIENIIVNEKNIKNKINLLQFLAFYYNDYVTGIYSSSFLEQNLLDISNFIELDNTNNVKAKNNTVLHVITIPFEVGGHTRVVNNWIEFDDKRKYSILINQPNYSKVPIWLQENVEKSGGNILLNYSDDLLEKAKFLAENAAKYEKVVLHVDNWDIVPVIAFGNKLWEKTIYLYNHSDHLFWVGISVADVILDLTYEGMQNSIKKRGSRNDYVLPIPIKNKSSRESHNISDYDKKIIKQKLEIPIDSTVILSMAADYKYTDIENFNFSDFAKKLINIQPNIYILIIGANKKSSKWIKLKKISNGRIRAEGIVSKENVCQYMKIADVYIDSFPMNSYTSLLEAIEYDIPAISLKTPIPDLDALSCVKVNSESEMICKIQNLLANKINRNESQNLKNNIARFHYRKNWNIILDEIFNKKIKHSIVMNKVNNEKTIIDDYDKFIYEVNEKYESFPITAFNKLTFKNKMQIIRILNYKLVILFTKIVRNKFINYE